MNLQQYKHIALAAVLIAGAGFSFLFGSYAFEVNGQFGFPLDDPWIHLQFAKNLHDYGSFSYYKNEMATAGSTSPLYAFLLAGGFFFTSDEMILSYVLGVGFLLTAALFVFLLVVNQRKGELSPGMLGVALGASLLLVLEPRMQWAAFSGMETTLFICLLLSTVYFYKVKNEVGLGLSSGLLIWTRPEAVILFASVLLDFIYHSRLVKRPRNKKKTAGEAKPSFQWVKRPLIIMASLATVYVAFNLFLSGSIFPNTFAAKLKYYGNTVRPDFPSQVYHFLADGHMTLPAIFAGLGILDVLLRLVRRREQTQLVSLLFPLGMFLAYWMKLPFLYQEGRYMMPLLPFVLLMAVSGGGFLSEGSSWVVKSFGRKTAYAVVTAALLVVTVQFAESALSKRAEYAGACDYITDRQVHTAKWLRENTPENAIIGTHDIGALAFYSGRRIADMVGLVSPEMIERIGSLTKLQQFLEEKKVTHLAVLRNWFEVVNQQPLFKTNERAPEIMEVFVFDPQRTHFTPQDVSRVTVAARQYLYQGQHNIAVQILQRALAADPRNSTVHQLLGAAFLTLGKVEEGDEAFTTALRLDPDALDARVGLAQIAARKSNSGEAIGQLEKIVEHHPDYPGAYRALAEIYSTFKRDSAKADSYLRRFSELVRVSNR